MTGPLPGLTPHSKTGGMDVEGGRVRRPVEPGRIERGLTLLGLLGALAFVPFMVTWWMAHGWPAYPETYFVGLVAIPAAIFGAGRLLASGVTYLRRLWQGDR